MKATEANFLQFLQGTKQFIIPIYQRTYSWTTRQCQQLWDDIERVAQEDVAIGHFIGSVVYIQEGIYHMSSVPQLLVIDGQQRLTTLSLLLVALGKAIDDKNEDAGTSRQEIVSDYLINSSKEGARRPKLLLTQSDRETLIRIVEDKVLPAHPSARIIENYRFFEERLKHTPLSLKQIVTGINKLIIVDVALVHGHDNPQLIFESLNSTGLDLSEADLIRNYVLMGMKPTLQDEIYTHYWQPMEESFGHVENADQFNGFMRDYLTVKTGRIPTIREVYAAFKQYVQASGAPPITTVVKDIAYHAKHYVKIAFSRETDSAINDILIDINTLRVEVAYPFLLGLYDDFAQELLSKPDLITILRLVESYVFRRLICGIPTQSLNKTFATLLGQIDTTRYVESVQAHLLLLDSYKRFPLDDEFTAAFVVRDIYNLRNRNYVLRKLENRDSKEQVKIEGLTIEHIMPQNENLSPEWQAELGSDWQHIRGAYLHTIGNLTLTAYNSELSDRPFTVKRNMKDGFAVSPLRLNKELAVLEHWNEADIIQRANVLAELARTIWPAPTLPDAVLKSYKTKVTAEPVHSSTEHPHLQGGMLTLFEQLRERILNLDSSVHEEIKKLYFAYKTSTNFVDVVPGKHRLYLWLNMAFSAIDDPKKLCADVTGKSHWGNGDIGVNLTSADQLDDVMALVRQAYQHQADNEAAPS